MSSPVWVSMCNRAHMVWVWSCFSPFGLRIRESKVKKYRKENIQSASLALKWLKHLRHDLQWNETQRPIFGSVWVSVGTRGMSAKLFSPSELRMREGEKNNIEKRKYSNRLTDVNMIWTIFGMVFSKMRRNGLCLALCEGAGATGRARYKRDTGLRPDWEPGRARRKYQTRKHPRGFTDVRR